MKKEYITPELMSLEMQMKPICTISGGTISLDDDHVIDAGASLGHEFEFDFGDDFNVSEAFKDDFSE